MAPPRLDEGLTLAVSTLGDRLSSIPLPEPRPGLSILILWQDPRETPAHLDRGDITLKRLETRGVAASRNAALEAAEGPLLLFWDDDILPDLDGITTLAAHLSARPELSVVTGRLDRGGRLSSATAGPLTRRRIARTGTPEIMLRLADLRAAEVRFDPAFGIGGRYPLGDEFVFLADCLSAGLKGWHLPVTLGRHPPQSTGANWRDPMLLRARAATIRRVFGPVQALPMGAAFAAKHLGRMGPRNALRFPWMCLGAKV